jgi:transcriptional regulator with XRE-family HTH domain
MTGDQGILQVPEGVLLRALRAEDGLRQRDVASRLGVNRSTLANIEAGREPVSGAMLLKVLSAYPHWRVSIEAGEHRPSVVGLNASLVIEELTIAYVFLESHSPSEILQIRRVRALRSGISHYALGLRRTDQGTFTLDTQVLWGGRLNELEAGPDQEGRVLRVVEFPRPLRSGEVHEFAMRSWVERDDDPGTEVRVAVTTRTKVARIHLACHGTVNFADVWKFGPVPDPGAGVLPADSPNVEKVDVVAGTPVSVTFRVPECGPTYGVGWAW